MAEKIGHGHGRSVRAFLPIEPPDVTHNDLKAYVVMQDGKPSARIRKSDRLKGYEDNLKPHVERVRDNMSGGALDGPLREVVKLCYEPSRDHPSGQAKVTKPDVDNVVKTLNDVLEGCGIIANDSRICDMRVIKAYSSPAGIWVSIEELER